MGDCIVCESNKVFDPATKKCICKGGPTYHWNPITEICEDCVDPNHVLDDKESCICDPTVQDLFTNTDTNRCFFCPAPRVWENNKCDCAEGTYWNGLICKACALPRVWDKDANDCICPDGKHFFKDGTCGYCPSDQVFNPLTSDCKCKDSALHWNATTQSCMKCPKNQLYDSLKDVCYCPALTNLNTDTLECVPCESNKIWYEKDNKCDCPQKNRWNSLDKIC